MTEDYVHRIGADGCARDTSRAVAREELRIFSWPETGIIQICRYGLQMGGLKMPPAKKITALRSALTSISAEPIIYFRIARSSIYLQYRVRPISL